jgi:AcrR family transcriptional regulator
VPTGGEGDSKAGAELGPLPGGHHGLSPQQVAESQRERLLAATAELVGDRGFGGVPVVDISKHAAVATRVFYANFESKEAAFIAAFDAVVDHLGELLAAAAAGEEQWPDQIVAGLRVALGFFSDEPHLARFCLIAPFTATSEITAHCRERAAPVLPCLARGRSLQESAELPASTEDSLLGGIVSQISRATVTGAPPLDTLLPDLVEFVLAPYLGREEARRRAATV